MPGLDGVEVARRVRALPGGQALPVVLLSSLGHRPADVAGLGLRHLTKPVKAGPLREALTGALGAQRTSGPQAAPVPLPRLRVLLAEDNVVNQKVATLMLERLGQRPDVVGDGLEALAALRSARYDVVLMDVQMPHMDGLEATRAVRARFPADQQPRIVGLTASALVEDRDRCLEAGMDDYLTKPVRAEELEARPAAASPPAAPTPTALVPDPEDPVPDARRPMPMPCPTSTPPSSPP